MVWKMNGMRWLQIAILSVAFVLPGQAEAATKDGRYLIWGGGQSSCGIWSNAKSTNEFIYSSAKQWVEGYVSAYNHYRWQGNNVASEIDGNGLFAWWILIVPPILPRTLQMRRMR